MQEEQQRKILAIGCDHAGVALKKQLINFAQTLNWETLDCGTNDENSVDYPDFAKLVCNNIINNKALFGLLICGTGIGMSIMANRFQGIRAALCHQDDEAKMAKQKNHANVLCLGAKIISPSMAKQCLQEFLFNKFDPTPRHVLRIKKLG